MIFVPKIDLSEYCDSEGNYTRDGSAALLEYSDRFFKEYDERKDKEKKEYIEICGEIDDLLESDNNDLYSEINNIITSSVYQRLCGVFYDLAVFRSSYAVYYTERCMNVFPTIYDIVNSIDEYFNLQMQVLYCFRRIQLNCPDDETEGMLDELWGRGISLYYMVQMLSDITVGDKGYVGMKLAELYEKRGGISEAAILRNHIKRNYGLSDPDTWNVPESDSNFTCAKDKTDKPADKVICFVTCVNNDRMYEECLYHINRLEVPSGYRVITKEIRDAASMTAGYNRALEESKSDITIYLHQDVCILNPFFLIEIIKMFNEDPDIGMIGMIGSIVLPPDGIMWNGKRIGNLYSVRPDRLHYNRPDADSKTQYDSVEAIDGFLMATNRNIRWREDIFDGWDFYDVSQCTEYRRVGFKVVVPVQDSPWTAHDDGIINIYNYDKYRKTYLKEYKIT